MAKQKFYITTTLDFEGYADYYSGHGHAFDNETLACIQFSTPINYSETVKELIESIMDDINGLMEPFYFLNDAQNNKDLQTQIEEYCTDKRLKQSIREEFNVKRSTQKAFDISKSELKEINEAIEESYDYPVLIGYIHITKRE